MFKKLYCWSQLSQCALIMHLLQTKFWNQFIRVWHRPTSFQEIALGFNILSVTSFHYVTLNWNITIFFPMKHEQLFATHKSIQSHFLKDGPCWRVRRAGMLSLLSRAAQMQFATGSAIAGYSRGHWRTVGNVSTAVLTSTFEVSVSYKKNLTKFYFRLNIREISLWTFFPTRYPELPQNLKTTWMEWMAVFLFSVWILQHPSGHW